MQKQQFRNSWLLLLTATIWGTAFVAQSIGMDYVEPFTFNYITSINGGIVLITFNFIINKSHKKKTQKQNTTS